MSSRRRRAFLRAMIARSRMVSWDASTRFFERMQAKRVKEQAMVPETRYLLGNQQVWSALIHHPKAHVWLRELQHGDAQRELNGCLTVFERGSAIVIHTPHGQAEEIAVGISLRWRGRVQGILGGN